MLALAPNSVQVLQTTRTPDAHGWATATTGSSRWQGSGNLQIGPPTGYTDATDRGGSGPHDPRLITTGSLYLPPDAAVEAGDLIVIDGQRWRADTVQPTLDPTGGPWSAITVQVTKAAP